MKRIPELSPPSDSSEEGNLGGQFCLGEVTYHDEKNNQGEEDRLSEVSHHSQLSHLSDESFNYQNWIRRSGQKVEESQHGSDGSVSNATVSKQPAAKRRKVFEQFRTRDLHHASTSCIIIDSDDLNKLKLHECYKIVDGFVIAHRWDCRVTLALMEDFLKVFVDGWAPDGTIGEPCGSGTKNYTNEGLPVGRLVQRMIHAVSFLRRRVACGIKCFRERYIACILLSIAHRYSYIYSTRLSCIVGRCVALASLVVFANKDRRAFS